MRDFADLVQEVIRESDTKGGKTVYIAMHKNGWELDTNPDNLEAMPNFHYTPGSLNIISSAGKDFKLLSFPGNIISSD